MTERLRSPSAGHPNFNANKSTSAKMASDLSPRKSLLVLVIVVGCFAVLWPKVFYPMLVGSANQHMKPSPIDKTTGCCDVISETDVNTIKIMSELCSTIIKQTEDKPLTGREIVSQCRNAVLDTCGIDIAAVLQEQVRLGQTTKQILDEVRSLNGSLCLKYNFGVAPWRLGVAHRVTLKTPPSADIRQERPPHLRPELVHPAFRERGRAIPQSQGSTTPPRPTPRIVEGRPGPVPGMRPTIGGPGHVVSPKQGGTSSMSVIMPIYTIGIVIFFTYTLMKIIFKKQPEGVGGNLYPSVEPDRNFQREVFESTRAQAAPKLTRDGVSSKLVVNAMSALLDEVDQEIEARRKASEVSNQDDSGRNLSNGNAVKPQEKEQPSVKVLGMEMTASCEGGKKWSRPGSPVTPSAPHPAEPLPPPQEIYLEGALPPQSQLLVSDSATETQQNSEEDPAVVLAGKMTLSVISLDSSENGTEDSTVSERRNDIEIIEYDEAKGSSSNGSEGFEKIDLQLEDQIDEIIQEAQSIVEQPKDDEEIRVSEEKELKQLETENVEQPIQQVRLEEINSSLAESVELEREIIEKPIHQMKFEETKTSVAEIVENKNEQSSDYLEGSVENIKQLEQIEDIKPSIEEKDISVDEEQQASVIDRTNSESIVEIENVAQPSEETKRSTEEKTPTETNNTVSEDSLISASEKTFDVEDTPGITRQEQLDKNNTEDSTGADVEELEEDEDLEEEIEVDEDDEELEEVVYEETDSEDVEDEIRNVNERIPSPEERSSTVGRVNGNGVLEESKIANVGSGRVAENELSEEEDDEDVEDEEIEEIIEYVDEEEEDEDNANNEVNNLNHVQDGSEPE